MNSGYIALWILFSIALAGWIYVEVVVALRLKKRAKVRQGSNPTATGTPAETELMIDLMKEAKIDVIAYMKIVEEEARETAMHLKGAVLRAEKAKNVAQKLQQQVENTQREKFAK